MEGGAKKDRNLEKARLKPHRNRLAHDARIGTSAGVTCERPSRGMASQRERVTEQVFALVLKAVDAAQQYRSRELHSLLAMSDGVTQAAAVLLV
eukprot:6199350-Pleurochrysis_carterae.AAC.6